MTTYTAAAKKVGIDEVPKNKEKVVQLRDRVERYDEASVCEGLLGRFPGSEAIGILKNFRDSVKSLL